MAFFKNLFQAQSSQNSRSATHRIGRLESLESRDLLTFLAQIGGTERDTTSGGTTDDEGNTYITGQFEGAADFDPGESVFELNSELRSVYVAKYDSTGGLDWARSFDVDGRTNGLYGAQASATDITIDGSGAVYVTGWFNHSIDFEDDHTYVTSTGRSDIFVTRLDAATGDTVWAKTFGGRDSDRGHAVAVHNDHVYITGLFWDTVDFDPGTGVNELTAANADGFILDLDADGQFVNAWNFGGPSTDYGHSLVVDADGVFVAGTFFETADFDPSAATNTRTSQGLRDWFLASYSTTGSLNWVQSIGNQDNNRTSVALTGDDAKLYFASELGTGILDIDPTDSEFSLETVGGGGTFLAGYSKSNGTLDVQFSPALFSGDSGDDYADLFGNVTVDSTGAVYLGVGYSGKFDIDPDESILNTPLSDGSSVLLKLDSTGSYTNHWLFESSYPVYLSGIVNDTMYFAGGFRDTATFPNGETLTEFGNSDVYVMSLTDSAPPIANAGPDVLGIEGQSVIFDASASTDPEGDPLSYRWDFGDGQTFESADAMVDHVYAYGGEFEVNLTVVDASGGSASDSVTATITEVNDAPIADAGGPYTGFVGVGVTLDASASFDFDNSDGTSTNDETLQFTWNFGDGTPSVVTNDTVVDHAYSAAGAYTITLIVSDGMESSTPTSTTAVIEDAPVGNPNDIYVWDIADAFETRQRGRNNTDHRVVLTVRNDSDGDGIAEATDAVLANVGVTVELRDANDNLVTTLTGTTDANGLFLSDWIKGLDTGEYSADVVDLALNTYEWNPLLDVEDSQLLTV